jgi:hypothetical protein
MNRFRIGFAIVSLIALGFAGASRGDDSSKLQECVRTMRENGKEPLAFVVDRFRDHDLLLFDDGMHTAVEPFAFCQKLIREPAFQRQVKYIFLEALPINHQSRVNAYLDAEPEDATTLYPVFQDDYGVGFPYRTYFDLLHTVYEVNRKLPAAERLRVVCVSNPVHWIDIKTAEDLALFRKGLAGRDALMYQLILDELDGFRSGRKGIFLTNTRHAYKAIRDSQNRLYWNCGTYFHERHPGRTYSIRCHYPALFIERPAEKRADRAATTAGTESFVYRWARPGRGLWDEAWQQLGNKPMGVPLAGNLLGREPYIGNHMLDVAPGQTFANAYDAVLFLVRLEHVRQTAIAGEIYTPAFKPELARRYRLLMNPTQLTAQLKEAGVQTLEDLINKEHTSRPECPLPQLEGLEPTSTWRKGR